VACLDESTIAAYAEGRLDGDARTSALTHVDSCAACRRMVAAVAAAASGGASAPVEERALASACIDRYSILGVLGAGAMGRVYEAYDPELHRKVAIKLLHRKTKSPAELQARLLREAQAMARLDHPHVLRVFHVGMVADQVFVVMELVDGMTLGRWLHAEQRDWRTIVDVFRRAGEGLAAAHAAGIVHRDFKPDNVLVGSDGRVLIGDFGLARLDGDGAADGSATAAMVTQSGALLGTPAYMAPEQLAGRQSDARADIFSFCVALHEALFGVRPFAGDTIDALARAIAVGTIARGRPSGPAWLRRAIAGGLAASPGARTPTMVALLAALAGDGRRRSGVALFALIAIAAVAAVAAVAWRAGSRSALCRGARDHLAGIWDPARRDEAARAFAASGVPFADDARTRFVARLDAYADAWVAMRTEACEATQLRRAQPAAILDARMSCLDDRLRALAAATRIYRSVDRTAVALAAEVALPPLDECADARALAASPPPPADPSLRAAVDALHTRVADERALGRAGRFQAALAAARANADEARRLDQQPEIAVTHYELGVNLSDSDPAAARVALQTCAFAAQRAADDLRASSCWDGLARLAGVANKRHDAEQLLELAQAALDRHGGDDHAQLRLLGAHHISTGRVAELAGSYERARGEYQQAVDILARVLPESEELAKARGSLCGALASTDHVVEALTCEREVLALFERIAGPSHPETAVAVNNLAVVELQVGHAAESLRLHDRALAIDTAWLVPGDIGIGLDLEGRADALNELGRFGEALADAERARAILASQLAPTDPEMARVLDVVGGALLGLGRRAEARATLERALPIVNPGDDFTRAEVSLLLARTLPASQRARALRLVDEADAALTAIEQKRGTHPRLHALLRALAAWRAGVRR
jgi:tRNA A-37 threonylcarbamoyl transferase component Bud32/tetratricopeptide (TPR) repeat protein